MKKGTIFQIGDKELCKRMHLPESYAHKLAITTSDDTEMSFPHFRLLNKPVDGPFGYLYVQYNDIETNIVLDPKS